MILKLDPSIPAIWRTPFSVQFGVDPARLVLQDVSRADEHVLAALAVGASKAGLMAIGIAAGATTTQVDTLLRQLSPLFIGAPTALAKPVVAIVGTGPTVECIATTLVGSGIRVEVSRRPQPIASDFGIAVGNFVLEPECYGFWLRRDVPHLAVTFGERSVTVGPLVVPGASPCLYCLEHHRRDEDASWSAIAAQLWGRRSPAETPLASQEAAALAARLVARHLVGDSPRQSGSATSVRISAETGEQARRVWLPHPDCGCVRVPEYRVAGRVAVERTA